MITRYELNCGCIERKGSLNNITVTLWKEHNVYHVRAHDFVNSKRIMWQSFQTLKPARNAFTSWSHWLIKKGRNG